MHDTPPDPTALTIDRTIPAGRVTGATGAGAAMLRMRECVGRTGHIGVGVRRYGCVKPDGERFRRLRDSVRLPLARQEEKTC